MPNIRTVPTPTRRQTGVGFRAGERNLKSRSSSDLDRAYPP
jgi:hypothetical protein